MGRRRSLLPRVLAVSVLLAAGLLVAWYFRPEWQPDWAAGRVLTSPAAEVELYRWQNASGEWMLTDQPPGDGIDYEILRYRYDANVLPGIEKD